MWRYSISMTPVVESAPRLTTDDAVRLARDIYRLDAAAEPLPSERDQNFLLRDLRNAGGLFVLKIANAREDRRILDLQIRALQFLSACDTGLEWPRLIPAASGAEMAVHEGHMVRLLSWVEGTCFALIEPHSPALLASLGRAL